MPFSPNFLLRDDFVYSLFAAGDVKLRYESVFLCEDDSDEKNHPSFEGRELTTIFKTIDRGRLRELLLVSITARVHAITTDSGQRTWQMIGRVARWPTSPISTGHVNEIAEQIMFLADASLITALLSISNYTGCLAEREGRWTSYWKSLYCQYSHQTVMPSLLKQTFSSRVITAQSSAGFHFSCLIRGYFTLGMQSEYN